MIELLTVLENTELVNCMDENARHYSGALLLNPQYSWLYEDRIVWENTDIENSFEWNSDAKEQNYVGENILGIP